MKEEPKKRNNYRFSIKNIFIFFTLFLCMFLQQGQGEESPVLYQTKDLVPLWTATHGYISINNPEELQLDSRENRITYAFPIFNQPIDILTWEVTFRVKKKYNEDFRAGLGLAEMNLNNPKTYLEIGILKGNEIRANPIGFSPKMLFTVPEDQDIKISIQKGKITYGISVNNENFSTIPVAHLPHHLYPVIYIQSCSAVFKNMKLSLIEQEQKKTTSEINLPQLPTEKIAKQNYKTLPRIRLGEKNGKKVFVTGSNNELFVPRGFNHVVLEHGNSGWHALFNTCLLYTSPSPRDS